VQYFLQSPWKSFALSAVTVFSTDLDTVLCVTFISRRVVDAGHSCRAAEVDSQAPIDLLTDLLA